MVNTAMRRRLFHPLAEAQPPQPGDAFSHRLAHPLADIREHASPPQP